MSHSVVSFHLLLSFKIRIYNLFILFVALQTTHSLSLSKKGEELIVVTTSDINLQDLKKALRHEGLPNLWMPQQTILLNEIPLLPTGKVNWKEIRSLTA